MSFQGVLLNTDVNITIAFVSGLTIGATPYVLLMVSAFGTSLILIEEKLKFIEITIRLILFKYYLKLKMYYLKYHEELIFKELS